MGKIDDIQTYVQRYLGDSVLMRRVNGWLTIIWGVMVPISVATGWVASVVFVSIISLYANFATHLSAWMASRAEVQAAKTEEAEHS